MRRSFSLAAAAAGILLLFGLQPGCGGGNSNSGAPASALQERIFAANQGTVSSTIHIIDASKDQITAFAVTPSSLSAISNPLPQLMIPGANNTTLVFNAFDNDINIVDNTKEALVTTVGTIDCTKASCVIPLAGSTESIAESSDGKTIYAAIRTASQVAVADLTGSAIAVKNIPDTPGNCQTTKNCLPGARRLVLSHNNSKLLVFNEDLNQFEVINTTDKSVQTITGLDHPTFGVFSSDDSKAYILNCGPECGGTQASVAVLDMTALTVGQTVNVDAATIATSDTTNLYLAGSNPNTPEAGSFTVLPLSSLSGAKQMQIKIGNGFHQVISVFQNKVIVGARTCTTGCLSLIDPAAGTAVVDNPAQGQTQKGDVTAIAPVTPRAVFYVAEGGEVRIYDVSNLNEHLINNTLVIDLVGKVTSVLYAGPKT